MHESNVMTTATFRLSPDLKARVDNLAKKTNRSSSYFSIIENVKKGKEKTVPLEKVMADYGL